MPITMPSPVARSGQARRAERRRSEQSCHPFAVGERFGREDARVDRLSDAGDDAEAEHREHHDPAEHDDEEVGVVARPADRRRHDAEAEPGDRRGAGGQHGTHLLAAAVPQGAPQQPPAEPDVRRRDALHVGAVLTRARPARRDRARTPRRRR
jgi:hypothetical protein